MSTHALLSPSSAERWLNCTPSARLESKYDDTTSQAAKEGTLAHSLGELLIKYALKRVSKALYRHQLAEIQANDLYDDAMMDHCDEYVTFVLERFAEAQAHTHDAILYLEQRLDLTEYIPEGFGTGDAIIIADGTLDLIDLKYGKGVEVSAVRNKQLMVYGLGALAAFGMVYGIDTIRASIYQPRLHNYSTYEITVADLTAWAKTELIPRAKLAFEGKGDFSPGKHCQFCRARATCRANADMQLEIAKYEFRPEAELNDEEIADVLKRAKLLVGWVTAVSDYALDQAVNKGKRWPGFKLVAGRSNRKYADEAAVVKTLTAMGIPEDILFVRKLLGITAMEQEIGKKVFESALSPLVLKPEGKPALVPDSDKRPALNSMARAEKDFEGIE